MNTQREALSQSDYTSQIPMYVAGLLTGVIGICAFASINGVDAYMLLMLALLLLGFTISWLVTTGALSKWVKDALVGLILLISVIAMASRLGSQSMNLYSTYMGANYPNAAGFMTWLITVYSFNLTSPKAVLFLCVPVLSLIGLSATLGAGAEAVMYFILFAGLAAFMLIQERVLVGFDGMDAPTPEGVRTPYQMSRRVGLAAGIAIAALLIGALVGSVLYTTVNTYFFPGFSMYHLSNMVGQIEPQNQAKVADGPVPKNDQEVMTISADEGQLWRGQTYNQYSGGIWSDSNKGSGQWVHFPRGRIHPWIEDNVSKAYRINLPPDRFSARRRATKRFEQVIHVTTGRLRIIFAAAVPKTIFARRDFALMKSDGKIEMPFGLWGGESIKVISQISIATPDQLRGAPVRYPAAVVRRYMGVPASCRKVKPLARQITGREKTPYDKAAAICNYLIRNYTYDSNTPATPHGHDPVPYFLFESKRGYCDVFASSMVVMCRQVGIPARWVTGFATGEYSAKDKMFHVRVEDKHAWVEVFFPDYGWIEFDPTPGGGQANTENKIAQAWNKFKLRVEAQWPTLVVGVTLFLIVVYIVKSELVDRYMEQHRKLRANGNRAVETYQRMSRLLARSGFPRYRSVTPTEYASDMDEKLQPGLTHLARAIKIITTDFEESRYADRALPQERIDRGIEMLAQLKKDLREAKKQRVIRGV